MTTTNLYLDIGNQSYDLLIKPIVRFIINQPY